MSERAALNAAFVKIREAHRDLAAGYVSLLGGTWHLVGPDNMVRLDIYDVLRIAYREWNGTPE